MSKLAHSCQETMDEIEAMAEDQMSDPEPPIDYETLEALRSIANRVAECERLYPSLSALRKEFGHRKPIHRTLLNCGDIARAVIAKAEG